jgi:peptidoglycan/xylan/chitin deacetylase (PgdA/CDA1 family)
MARAFLSILLAGWLLGPAAVWAADVAAAQRLDRRILAPSPDYAVPRMAGTVSRARIAEAGWQHCALTFDDGPNEVTPRILAILEREGVTATYFPVAEAATRHPAVIRGFISGGHEIGNHSLRHANLSKMSKAAARADLAEANRQLRTLGARPALFRPPYAGWDAGVVAAAHEVGLETVLWSLDVRDWELRDAGMLAARVNAGAGPATVVLLHATYEWTATALPQIIAALRNHGCRFVTLSDWLGFMRGEDVEPARVIPIAATQTAAAPPPLPAVAMPAVARIETAPAVAPVEPPAPFVAAPIVDASAPMPEPPAQIAQAAPSVAPPAPRPAAPRAAPAPTRAPPPRPAAVRPTPAVTLRPATVAPARGNPAKTEVRIQGDDVYLSLGPDADLDAIADMIKDALEKPRAPKSN